MTNEKVNNPSHYNDPSFDMETIEMMEHIWGEESMRIHCQMSAFKYRMRAGKKSDDPTEDIRKAEWYEQKARDLKYKEELDGTFIKARCKQCGGKGFFKISGEIIPCGKCRKTGKVILK